MSALARCPTLPRPTLPRLTAAQTAVVQALRQQPQPISAQALYVLMQSHQPVGLATVYRSLEALQRSGLVQHRVTIAGERLYSVVEDSPVMTAGRDRHYLTCLQCGQSFPLPFCPVAEFAAQLQQASSLRIYYHTLEFFGVCEPCILHSACVGQLERGCGIILPYRKPRPRFDSRQTRISPCWPPAAKAVPC
ncbi:Fur family transcriptional regulator [Trichothermofontia sp.]